MFQPSELPIPHEEIRSALLFFDKFDVPEQNAFGGTEWCTGEFDRVGVLVRSSVKADGDMAGIIQNAPFAAYEARDKIEPGRWTFARPAQAHGIPPGLLTPNAAVSITIQNALPVFTREVDLEDVLEFKSKARAELLALRRYLDELAADIGRNGANNVQETAAYKRFIGALDEHMKLMNRSNREKTLQSFKASFDLPSLMAPGLEAMFTGSLDFGSLGAAAAMIGIKTVAGLRRKRSGTNPFEYLTSAHLEL